MNRILIAATLASIVSTPAAALCTYIGARTICEDQGSYTETANERAYRQKPVYETPYSGHVDRNLPYGMPLHSCHYGRCD